MLFVPARLAREKFFFESDAAKISFPRVVFKAAGMKVFFSSLPAFAFLKNLLSFDNPEQNAHGCHTHNNEPAFPCGSLWTRIYWRSLRQVHLANKLQRIGLSLL